MKACGLLPTTHSSIEIKQFDCTELKVLQVQISWCITSEIQKTRVNPGREQGNETPTDWSNSGIPALYQAYLSKNMSL